MSELTFEYNVPIECNADLDGDFTIQGTAITETITSNGHQFLEDELRNAAKTLVGVPLLKDHNNSVDAIVGRVSTAFFDEANHSIPFKAIVKDKEIKEKIKLNLINSVSVGAHVDPKDIEEKDGIIIPHNIQFKELSLVAIPADESATFSVAFNNAYKLHSNEKSKIVERRTDKMTEKEITQTPEVKEPVETVEPAKEPSEEEVVEEKLRKVNLELKKKELVLAEKKLAEADKDEVEPEVKEPVGTEVETETETEEEETDVVEDAEKVNLLAKYGKNISMGHDSLTYERSSYVY